VRGFRIVKTLQPGDPQRVGRYQLLGRLGAGGMGQVFLGQSPGGRLVAVKLIRAELAADPEFRARFAREVAAARHVSGIFTAPVVDADPDAPQPWLVTAYVPGPSLADAVDGQGPLPLTSVLTLAAGLAEGLGAIHDEGMVHRDLKPSNVLLASDGPRIIDFGISRAADATALTRADLVIGSPGFMSPEQALGQDVGPASDIFSLGAVLAFASLGEGPFGGGTATALLYRVVHDRPATANLPGRIRPVVERCLAKDPRARPTTDQLLTELGAVESAVNWLPQPVAETLVGYARPVPGTAADITVPPAPAPPAPAPAAQAASGGPPAQALPSELAPPAAWAAPPAHAPTAPAGGRGPGGPGGRPSPGPMGGAGAPVHPAGDGASAPPPGPARPAPPPGAEPASVPAGLPPLAAVGYPAGAGPGPGVTAPLRWDPGTARPRRRWLGKAVAAGALVVVLAVAGFAAKTLASRAHPGGPTAPPTSSPAVLGPRAVVEAYFAAINAHEWRRVWALGGKNFGQTYSQMVAGYRSTVSDLLSGIVVHGDSVSLRLTARHADGTEHTYQASYVVHHGVITGGSATPVGTG
jgi:Protein kinase domain